MADVMGEPPIDVLDHARVGGCPVDCIHEGSRARCIHPDEFIACGACEPVCRAEPIHDEALRSPGGALRPALLHGSSGRGG
jgi:hypothetical protein